METSTTNNQQRLSSAKWSRNLKSGVTRSTSSDFDHHPSSERNFNNDTGAGAGGGEVFATRSGDQISSSIRARTSVPGARSSVVEHHPSVASSSSLASSNGSIRSTVAATGKQSLIDGGRIKSGRSKSEANLLNAENGSIKSGLMEPNPLTTVLTDDELLKFVSQPIPPEVTLQCTIIRDKKGLDRSLYPTYYMHLQEIVSNGGNGNNNNSKCFGQSDRTTSGGKMDGGTAVWMSDSLESIDSDDDDVDDGENPDIGRHNQQSDSKAGQERLASTSAGRKVFVLSGRRRKKSKTYLIGNNAFDISRDRCIAKLKSNVLGTQFTAIRIHQNGVRYEIGSITYETNVLGFKGPRKMTIIIPKPDEEELKRNSRAILLLKNKTPIWNEETQSYVLNFHGRVTQASVKNFQLVVVPNTGGPDNHHRKRSSDLNDDTSMRRSASSHQLSNHRRSDFNINGNLDDDDDDDEDDDGEPEQVTGGGGGGGADQDSIDGDYDRRGRRKSGPGGKSLTQTKTLSKSGYLTAYNSEDAKQIADTGNELVSLQFGRVSNTHFSCDVSWPLSLVQAFAIALSSFDSKLACE